MRIDASHLVPDTLKKFEFWIRVIGKEVTYSDGHVVRRRSDCVQACNVLRTMAAMAVRLSALDTERSDEEKTAMYFVRA